MAVVCNASTEYLNRTPIMRGDRYTFMCWARPRVIQGSSHYPEIMGVNGSGLYRYIGLGDTGALTWLDVNGTAGAGTYVVAAGALFHITYTKIGSTHTLWINGLPDVTVTTAEGTSITDITLCDDGGGVNDFDGQVFGYKVWDGVALNRWQIRDEMRQMSAANPSGNIMVCPLSNHGALTDWKAGRNLTPHGTISTDASKPLPWFTAKRNPAAMASNIRKPTNVNQSVNRAGTF